MKEVWCFQLLVETFFLYVLQCTLQNMEGTKVVDEVCSFFFFFTKLSSEADADF